VKEVKEVTVADLFILIIYGILALLFLFLPLGVLVSALASNATPIAPVLIAVVAGPSSVVLATWSARLYNRGNVNGALTTWVFILAPIGISIAGVLLATNGLHLTSPLPTKTAAVRIGDITYIVTYSPPNATTNAVMDAIISCVGSGTLPNGMKYVKVVSAATGKEIALCGKSYKEVTKWFGISLLYFSTASLLTSLLAFAVTPLLWREKGAE
jgi:hypothetical protein